MSSHPQGLFCPILPPVCGIGWKRSTTSLSRCYTEYEKIAGKIRFRCLTRSVSSHYRHIFDTRRS
nr:MAG TPA_asm: hypothetical protein [Caudoviricetes sp.]